MKTIIQMNFLQIIRIILITGLLVSCENPANKSLASPFDNSIAKDTVLSYRMHVKDSLCASWKIEKEQILDLIAGLHPVNDSVRLQCYGDFACEIEGVLRLNDTLYKYTINAGGWVVLSHEKDFKILGAGKKDSLYFVSTYYCNDDWGM